VYEDGTPGSPALVLDAATTVAAFRTLECLFVERKPKNFAPLVNLVAQAKADGIACEAFKGDISTHLDALMTRAGDAPTFVFLDPFGFGLPFDDIVAKILREKTAAAGPVREALIHFSSSATWRSGGFLEKGQSAPNRDSTLEAVDTACGGQWWRDEFEKHETTEDRTAAIAANFAARLGERTGTATFTLPVRNREKSLPIYYLVFVTRHPDGIWLFNNALAKAQHE